MSSGERRRVCLLTGAGGTLGSVLCRTYGTAYDIVAVCGQRAPDAPSQFDAFLDPLDPSGSPPENAGAVYVVHCDLEKPGQVERVVDIALARFGRVDVLVNNAAYWRLHPGGLLDAEGSLTDFEKHFRVNVAVPLQLAGELARRFWMARADENRLHNRNVVNVSSLSGNRVYANQGQGIYAASKAALNQLSRHLAVEYAPFGVRVNALAPNSFPGVVDTARVAASVVRLDRETVTGQVLAVDAPAG